MAVRFGDLFDEMKTLKQAIEKVALDIENTSCDSVTKCRLEEELELLEKQYEELKDTEVDFTSLDLPRILETVEHCFNCIKFDGDWSSELFPQ